MYNKLIDKPDNFAVVLLEPGSSSIEPLAPVLPRTRLTPSRK